VVVNRYLLPTVGRPDSGTLFISDTATCRLGRSWHTVHTHERRSSSVLPSTAARNCWPSCSRGKTLPAYP